MVNVVKKYRKPYLIKRRRSFFKSRFFWLIVFFLIILGAIFHLLFFSDFFQIKKIIVLGAKKVSTEDIKLVVESGLEKKILFFKTKSIFLINLSKMRENILKKFPQIEKVKIDRELPSSLHLTLSERKEAGIFCQDTTCFLLDPEGVIFEFAQNESSLLKLKLQNGTLTRELNLGEKAIEKEVLTLILEIALKLQENLKIPIKEVSMVGKEDGSSSSPFATARVSEEKIAVKTVEGWEIYFNLKEDLNWQITKLAAILEKRIPAEKRGNLKYIDLRFEKVYIFPETYNQ